MEIGETLSLGNGVLAKVSRNSNFFEIQVTDVYPDTYKMLLEDYEIPAFILVGTSEKLYETTPLICDADGDMTQMTFVYAMDILKRKMQDVCPAMKSILKKF